MIARRSLALMALAGTMLAAGPALALDEVTFGTNWKAQAEHGGYYQAVATGLYEEAGLKVTIRPGGPQVNHAQLLAAGKIDFNMGGSMFEAFNFVQNDVPLITVAAIFQKDPQVLIAHPGAGNDSLEAIKGKPVMISADGRTSFWQFLKIRYGFSDDQIRPYNYSLAPFLADKEAVQQGYLTSEPYAVEKEGGFKPVVHLLADAGYDTYSTTIQTSASLVAENPDLVQRFIDASLRGWYSYMYGDPAPANALIKQDNPDMTDDQLAFSRNKMKEYGIVDSGDSLELGIGAMTDQRIKSFFDLTVQAGLYPADLDLAKSYTLQFVNKKYGMEIKSK